MYTYLCMTHLISEVNSSLGLFVTCPRRWLVYGIPSGESFEVALGT